MRCLSSSSTSHSMPRRHRCCMAYETACWELNCSRQQVLECRWGTAARRSCSKGRRVVLLLPCDAAKLQKWSDTVVEERWQRLIDAGDALRCYVGRENYSWLEDYGTVISHSSTKVGTRANAPVPWAVAKGSSAADIAVLGLSNDSVAPLPVAPSVRAGERLVDVVKAETVAEAANAPRGNDIGAEWQQTSRGASQRRVDANRRAPVRIDTGTATATTVTNTDEDNMWDCDVGDNEDVEILSAVYLKNRHRREEEIYRAVLHACGGDSAPRQTHHDASRGVANSTPHRAASPDDSECRTTAGTSPSCTQLNLVQCPVLGLSSTQGDSDAAVRWNDVAATTLLCCRAAHQDGDDVFVVCAVCELPGILSPCVDVSGAVEARDTAVCCASCGAAVHHTCVYARNGRGQPHLFVCCESCALIATAT